jgi:hypothetical protein
MMGFLDSGDLHQPHMTAANHAQCWQRPTYSMQRGCSGRAVIYLPLRDPMLPSAQDAVRTQKNRRMPQNPILHPGYNTLTDGTSFVLDLSGKCKDKCRRESVNYRGRFLTYMPINKWFISHIDLFSIG